MYRFPGFVIEEDEECDCEYDGVECVCWEPQLDGDGNIWIG